jgi:hypothetical protein
MRAALGLFAVAAFAGSSAFADTVEYDISVNTASIAGTMGYLDFQFNPGPPTAAPATASLLNFVSGGTLNLSPGTLFTQGDVIGNLPGAVTFVNDKGANEYSPGFTYNNSIQFEVGLSWTQPVQPPDSPTSFFFWMYDSNFNPVLTSLGGANSFNQALELDINTDGSITAADFSPVLTVTPLTTVPEPGSFSLLICGAAVLIARRIRARR